MKIDIVMVPLMLIEQVRCYSPVFLDASLNTIFTKRKLISFSLETSKGEEDRHDRKVTRRKICVKTGLNTRDNELVCSTIRAADPAAPGGT